MSARIKSILSTLSFTSIFPRIKMKSTAMYRYYYPQYAENILRVNISMDEKDDVRTRRMEEVKIIKHGLDSFRDAFVIHEGYREIFIEIKKDRKLVIKRIFEMVERKMIKEINTFPSYLAWQKERVSRELKRSEEYRRNHNRGFEKKARMEDESSSESGTNPKRVRKV